MFAHTHFFDRSEHPRRSLLARGGLAGTFGSLACFLTLTFLGFGVYILVDAFANPIAAQAAAVVAAAFTIALASIILFYLFKPRGKLRVTRVKYREGKRPRPTTHNEHTVPPETGNTNSQLELPYRHQVADRHQARIPL